MANSSFRCVITPRDLEVLAALDHCPLTAQQLLKLSHSFCLPFTTERRVRERLQQLEQQHWLTSWLYATASRGGSPSYWKLTRDGYRVLHGTDAVLPKRRYFEEIAIGHHHHTKCLADFLVQTFVAAHRLGTRYLLMNRLELHATLPADAHEQGHREPRFRGHRPTHPQ